LVQTAEKYFIKGQDTAEATVGHTFFAGFGKLFFFARLILLKGDL
jgi:hypothetical protein